MTLFHHLYKIIDRPTLENANIPLYLSLYISYNHSPTEKLMIFRHVPHAFDFISVKSYMKSILNSRKFRVDGELEMWNVATKKKIDSEQ